MDESNHKSRRKVLKAMGGSVVGLSAVPAVTGTQGSARFEGVAYDPATHEILGSAAGQFPHTRNELVGTLEVDGNKIQLDNSHPQYENAKQNIRQEQFIQLNNIDKKKPDQKVKVLSHDRDTLSGVVRTPEFSRIAFSLVKRPTESVSELEEVIKKYSPKETEHIREWGESATSSEDEDVNTSSTCSADDCHSSRYNTLSYMGSSRRNDATDGNYRYWSYVTAEADNDTHEYDEIPSDEGWNRWAVQAFYEDTPTKDEDQYENCSSGTPCHVLLPSSVDYHVDVAYDTGFENTNAYVDNVYPNESYDGSRYSFGIRIGPSFGPVSGGLSWSIADNRNARKPDAFSEHRHVEWSFPLDVFPTEQEDCRGVRFNVNGGGSYREETFKIDVGFTWGITELTSTGGRYGVYSEQDEQTHYASFDVVDT